jgi:hypothetical protein
VADSCEYGNDPSGFLKVGEYLEYLTSDSLPVSREWGYSTVQYSVLFAE